jgi:hypothetical protein
MVTLASVQAAILQLAPEEQVRLRDWIEAHAPDLEEDSPEVELAVLQAVRGAHVPLSKSCLEDLAERALRERIGVQRG